MNTKHTFLAAACLALNLSLAKVAALLSLPVYLDSVGTILASAILPWPMVIAVALGTSLLGAFLINPYWAAFCGTQIVIAVTALLSVRYGLLSTWWKSVFAGIIIAIMAVIASAPATVLLFGGITLSGTTAINAILLASGHNIWKSVIGGSLLIESVDKPIAAVIAWFALRSLPPDLIIGRHSATGKTARKESLQ